MSEAARAFYTEKIPSQFNRALDEQEALAASGDDANAQRILDGMKAAEASIEVIVDGEGGGTFYLNVASGRMTAGDAPAREPFLTMKHGLEALVALERESGDSALGFLGGLAGLAGEIRLTAGRLDNLADVEGSMQFEMTGGGGFSLRTHFGGKPVPDEPDCSISVDGDAYAELKSGELNPQDAFMNGKIAVGGDMQMAMQLAFSVMAPD